jgi:hypothetical protein
MHELWGTHLDYSNSQEYFRCFQVQIPSTSHIHTFKMISLCQPWQPLPRLRGRQVISQLMLISGLGATPLSWCSMFYPWSLTHRFTFLPSCRPHTFLSHDKPCHAKFLKEGGVPFSLSFLLILGSFPLYPPPIF